MIEYIPDRRQGDPKQPEDAVLLFRGIYKATLYRRVSVATAQSHGEALAAVFKGVGRDLRRSK